MAEQNNNPGSGADFTQHPDIINIFGNFMNQLSNTINAGAGSRTGQGVAGAAPRLRDPDTYDGARNASMIDGWINTIERHKNFFGWDDARTRLFAITFLRGRADTWYRSLEGTDSDPEGWTELKHRLVETFRPDNATRLARDELAALTQTGSVSEYVNAFMDIRLLLIKEVTDNEACDRFIRGLSDVALRAHLRDIPDESLNLNEAYRSALAYDAARTEYTFRSRRLSPAVARQQTQSPSLPVSNEPTPMELDVVRTRDRDASRTKDTSNLKCFFCGKVGHSREECRIRIKTFKQLDDAHYKSHFLGQGSNSNSNRRGAQEGQRPSGKLNLIEANQAQQVQGESSTASGRQDFQ